MIFHKHAGANDRFGLNELRCQHSSNTYTATADITKRDEIEQAISSLHKELESIDLAIVCSGTGDINATLDYSVERPTIDTNVTSWTFVIGMIKEFAQNNMKLNPLNIRNWYESLNK